MGCIRGLDFALSTLLRSYLALTSCSHDVGLLRRGVLMTAFVRHNVKDPPREHFRHVGRLEDAMLRVMEEGAPDAGAEPGRLTDHAPLLLRLG